MDACDLSTLLIVKFILPVNLLLVAKSVSKIFTHNDVDKSHASTFRSNDSFHISTTYVVCTIHFPHVSYVLLNTFIVVTF